MSFRRVLALVLGSVAVHLAVVACGSADGPIFGQADPDAGAAGAGGGAEPEVFVEPCDKKTQANQRAFAEHSWPERTERELSRVIAIGHYATPQELDLPSSFANAAALPSFSGSSVGVSCEGKGGYFDSVTFILPP